MKTFLIRLSFGDRRVDCLHHDINASTSIMRFRSDCEVSLQHLDDSVSTTGTLITVIIA